MPTEPEQRHIDTVLAYLAASDACDTDAAGGHLAADAVQIEFPNPFTPKRTERDRGGILTGVRESGFFLTSQRTEVVEVMASGDRVAVEAVWTGVLKGALGPLQAGETLRIYYAMIFTLSAGKIAAQHNYAAVDVQPP